jgi:hypothetical protein
MRTQKRFTPKLLERFERDGRGTGTFQDYVPWHRVSRSDPSSDGRSHLKIWRKRQLELLSDGEWDGAHFVTLLPNVLDVREQLKLSLEEGPHELAEYDARYAGQLLSGTISIANQLGFKHPLVTGNGRSSDWVMTTDQVLLLKSPNGQLELLAISYKPDHLSLSKRDLQKLAIERAYWTVRSVQWLLITPDLFEKSVATTLRRAACWGLGSAVNQSEICSATKVVADTLGHTYTYTLYTLADKLGNKELAQRALWQAVWSGAIPMDLRRGWRPHLPIELLSLESFLALNPVAYRRSSWN